MSVLPRVLTHNWPLKLSSFGLALILWVVVTVLPRNLQTLTSVPVEVVVLDTTWTLAAPPVPPAVNVRLGGDTEALLSLPRSADATVRIEIQRVTDADTVVRLRADQVTLDPASGVVVEDILPSSVRLRLEPTRSTVVPLSLRTQGELPDGLALAQRLVVTPAVARVRAAERIVDRLDSLPLAPLELERLTESGVYRVPVDSSGLGGIVLEPAFATVAARVEPAIERSVVLPVLIEGQPEDSLQFVLTPTEMPALLVGVASRVDQVDESVLAVVVPARAVVNLEPGGSVTARVTVRGVPELVDVILGSSTVRVARPGPADGVGAGEGGAAPDTAGLEPGGGGSVLSGSR